MLFRSIRPMRTAPQYKLRLFEESQALVAMVSPLRRRYKAHVENSGVTSGALSAVKYDQSKVVIGLIPKPEMLPVKMASLTLLGEIHVIHCWRGGQLETP